MKCWVSVRWGDVERKRVGERERKESGECLFLEVVVE